MLRRPKLLVVDDEPNVALTLRLIFERDGYQVATAASCAEALALLSNGAAFDAIITDLNMEGPNVGLEVARAALELHPRPMVIICTGYADVLNARAALEMRVDFYATKPVNLDELKAAMRRFHEGRARTARRSAS